MFKMATFTNTDCVKYEFKGISAPLSELYFCRHCLELKSKQCVFHEVDSLFCPNCLESLSYGEAKVKKNRCAMCFDCPSCGHALSTRATTVLQEAPKNEPPKEDPSKDNPPFSTEKTTIPKKAFYLACGYCRWTSRDVHLKDQFVASGGWSEQVNPHAARIEGLMDHYKQLSLQELQEKERSKLRRKNYFVDKVGIGQLSIKRRAGFSLNLIKDQGVAPVSAIEPSKASDNFEELPDHYYHQTPNLTAVTSIQQRHMSPEFQPSSVSNLHPQRKRLLIKKSQRCKGCDHNLSKPEFNPSTIKFKIQLVAIHHIPEVRILKLPSILHDQPTRLILTLNNPLETLLRIHLTLPQVHGADDALTKVVLPSSELQISKCDEAAELDESPSFDDDPEVIAFRKGNKIGFYVTLTSHASVGSEVVLRMKLRHNYVKKVLPVPVSGGEKEGKEDELLWVEHGVLLQLGKVVQE